MYFPSFTIPPLHSVKALFISGSDSRLYSVPLAYLFSSSCLKIITYFKGRLRQVSQIIFSKLLLLFTNFYFSYELLSCTPNSRIILNILCGELLCLQYCLFRSFISTLYLCLFRLKVLP